MNLITCKLCGRLFSATRGKICVTCLDEIDDLYPKVREFLRDHSKENFNVEQIADGMDLDIRYVQALVELGYLDRGLGTDPEEEEEKRRKEALARQLQASLENSASAKASENAGKTYGQQRYGFGKKK
ncbi:hypothetical protein [Aminivibrio sp.]|uniref:hypothetical protein n=1 Tax=Aminivibrio sp. TaxID=1872489 RepID=UPI001A3F8E1F|nr:hypothetical protein [Aminivibrio sp.]MBL3539376.1 hypothetical protein [Aminivibrio sp.]MDK2959797.1 hypothetical protein [Synergistaceae bacterium]